MKYTAIIQICLWCWVPQAFAAHVDAVVLNGNRFSDISENNHIQFKVDWINTSSVLLDVRLDDGDTDPYLAFSATLSNRGRKDWARVGLELIGKPSWEDVYRVYSFTGKVKNIEQSKRQVIIQFFPYVRASVSPAEGWMGIVVIGNPATNDIKPMVVWLVNPNGLHAGDIFHVRLTPVPVE